MVPVLFNIKVSLALIAVFGTLGSLARWRHRKMIERYKISLVSWELAGVLLWGLGLLVLIQLVAQLPKYL